MQVSRHSPAVAPSILYRFHITTTTSRDLATSESDRDTSPSNEYAAFDVVKRRQFKFKNVCTAYQTCKRLLDSCAQCDKTQMVLSHNNRITQQIMHMI